MNKNIISFLVGLLFAIGLGISGMTKPQKVIGFLDIFGNFDPSLIFVMIGAISTHFIAYKLIRKKATPIFQKEWLVPNKKEITPSLIIGSFIFGVGWAIGGYCPGPSVVSLTTLKIEPLIFVICMILGMFIFKMADHFFKFKK